MDRPLEQFTIVNPYDPCELLLTPQDVQRLLKHPPTWPMECMKPLPLPPRLSSSSSSSADPDDFQKHLLQAFTDDDRPNRSNQSRKAPTHTFDHHPHHRAVTAPATSTRGHASNNTTPNSSVKDMIGNYPHQPGGMQSRRASTALAAGLGGGRRLSSAPNGPTNGFSSRSTEGINGRRSSLLNHHLSSSHRKTSSAVAMSTSLVAPSTTGHLSSTGVNDLLTPVSLRIFVAAATAAETEAAVAAALQSSSAVALVPYSASSSTTTSTTHSRTATPGHPSSPPIDHHRPPSTAQHPSSSSSHGRGTGGGGGIGMGFSRPHSEDESHHPHPGTTPVTTGTPSRRNSQEHRLSTHTAHASTGSLPGTAESVSGGSGGSTPHVSSPDQSPSRPSNRRSSSAAVTLPTSRGPSR